MHEAEGLLYIEARASINILGVTINHPNVYPTTQTRKHQKPCVSGRLPRCGPSAAAKRSIILPSLAVAAPVEASRIRALQLGKDTATSLAAATLLGLLSRLVCGFPFKANLEGTDN